MSCVYYVDLSAAITSEKCIFYLSMLFLPDFDVNIYLKKNYFWEYCNGEWKQYKRLLSMKYACINKHKQGITHSCAIRLSFTPCLLITLTSQVHLFSLGHRGCVWQISSADMPRFVKLLLPRPNQNQLRRWKWRT